MLKSFHNNTSSWFWMLTISVFIALLVPVLIQDGMFMDGVQYACVARNLANGEGSFWFPVISQTWSKAGSAFFMEHPPLAYGLQSVFFKILGNTMYTERIYSFLTACITAYLITRIWNLIFKNNNELQKLKWLPVLLWIIVPLCHWCYQNNMLENTMGVFTLFSVYCIFKSTETARPYQWICGAGISIFLATLSKGAPGLFPVVAVFIYYFIYKIPFRKTFLYSLLLISIPTLLYALLLLTSKDAFNSLSFYFNERFLHRVLNEPTAETRFFIIQQLFYELLPPLAVVVVVALTGGVLKKHLHVEDAHAKKGLFMLLVGLSASVPLLLTSVQSRFYLLPAIPFFALGAGALVAPYLQQLVDLLKSKKTTLAALRIGSVSCLIVAFVFSFLQFGKTSRDKTFLPVVHKTGAFVPYGSVVSVNPELYNHWGLQFYLLRYYNISIDASQALNSFYLTDSSTSVCRLCTPLFTIDQYTLYKVNP